eukprot:15339920-Ditylum_brightwellii.AAC.1
MDPGIDPKRQLLPNQTPQCLSQKDSFSSGASSGALLNASGAYGSITRAATSLFGVRGDVVYCARGVVIVDVVVAVGVVASLMLRSIMGCFWGQLGFCAGLNAFPLAQMKMGSGTSCGFAIPAKISAYVPIDLAA